jgi:AcrR family transcriptional regulator
MTDRRERNADKTRQDILDAAEEQFADKGFYGARVDEIADQARINKRMIYAYFGNKEELYKKVLFSVYNRLHIAEKRLQTGQYEGRTLIREIISLYFDFLRRNPGFVSILMWENLNKASCLKELPQGDLQRPTIQYFREAISRGKADGIFRTDIDENQVVISLITVCFANFSNCHTLSCLFGCDLCSETLIEQRKQQTVEMMLAYLDKTENKEQ